MSFPDSDEYEHVKLSDCEIQVEQNLKISLSKLLYASDDGDGKASLALGYYDGELHRIETHKVSFKEVSVTSKFKDALTCHLSKRRSKNRMFAFVNPSSGAGKGMETFTQKVLPILEKAGIVVDQQITEKDGENSLGKIAERIDLSRYDALIIVGGDSSLRDVLNGVWTKAGKPNLEQLQLPVFGLIPTGTGNSLAREWYGSFTVESAVAALLMGNVKKVQLFRVSFLDNPEIFDMLGTVCVAYGISVEMIKAIEDKKAPMLLKMMYGFGKSIIQHAEPFDAEIEINANSSEEDKKSNQKVRVRDLMVLNNDLSFNSQAVKSNLGSIIYFDANFSKLVFSKEFSLFGKRMIDRKEPYAQGQGTEGSMGRFVGNVQNVKIRIPESGNSKKCKDFINVDGNLFKCEPSLKVEFHHVLPCFVIGSTK